jgi:excisionase family DNA binding protein
LYYKGKEIFLPQVSHYVKCRHRAAQHYVKEVANMAKQIDTENCAVLTVPEAAKLMRVDRCKAYEWARQRKFPVKKIGGKYLVPKETFMAWLNTPDSLGVEAGG